MVEKRGNRKIYQRRAEFVKTSPVIMGWRNIADYLGVSMPSAMKWAKENGMPVKKLNGPHIGPIRCHKGRKGGVVITTKNLLQVWILKQKDFADENKKIRKKRKKFLLAEKSKKKGSNKSDRKA